MCKLKTNYWLPKTSGQYSYSFELTKRTNNENRVRALAMLEYRLNGDDVAVHLIKGNSTISHQIQRVRETGTCADRPRPAAPRQPTVKQENVIRQRHLGDTFLKAECCRVYAMSMYNASFKLSFMRL